MSSKERNRNDKNLIPCTLHWKFSTKTKSNFISTLRGSNKVAFYALTEYGSSDEETSWIGREQELKAFSLNYPGVLFQLSVDDERHSEYSREYYKDGQMQKVVAELVYPSCTL